jgi:hypothetical protein
MMDNMSADHLNIIWKWVPYKWRPMWLDKLTLEFGMTLDSSESFFYDLSSEVSQLEEDLAAMTLVKLKEALNQHPYTNVKCPWGCDEFPEMCKGLPLYAFISSIFSRNYPAITLPLSDSSIVYGEGKAIIGKKKLVGIRPDYPFITTFMLDNPNWPIRACLRFITGEGPMVLVCSEHEEGSTKMFFHVPASPINGNLPSVSSPKLAHATITPRTIQTMKLHKFSNTYQLVNTQANCGGIDSCYLTEHSHFDTPLSPVGKTDEMCFLSQRNDMRARLKYLAYSSQIPYTIAEEKLKNASDSCLLYDYLFQQCLQGSTHLSLFDTLLLEKHLQEYKHSEKEITRENTTKE